MLKKALKYIPRLVRYYYWKYEEDLLWVIGIIFLAWIMYHAYPVDPNQPI